MEAVISYVKTVLFFLLFVNLVMQLLYGSSYERFVRPVCGMILVILIIKPVLLLFGAEEQVLFAAEQKISLFLAQSETDYVAEEKNGYEFVVLEAYKKELTAGLANLLQAEGLFLVSAEFSVSAEEKDFGTIRGLTVTAQREGNMSYGMIEIAPVIFGKEKKEDTLSAEEIRIKDKLKDFYQLKDGNIYVNIKEEHNG